MKKFLSVLLTLAMLLGCCTFVAVADEATADTTLLVDDLVANKGTTQSYLHAENAAWNETYQLFDSGVDTYLVYKINVPAGQGAVATVDFMDWTDIGNGGVHQYSEKPKYECYVTTVAPAEDFAGNTEGEDWVKINATEEVALDTFTYTYKVDSAAGHDAAVELYVCFKFAANDAEYEGMKGWNDGAWVEKIAFDAVPYTGIVVYHGTEDDAWTTGKEEIITDDKTGKTNVCRDFTLAAGSYAVADLTACFNLATKEKSLDISEMDFLRFDMYIEDKMKVSDTEFCIELTSSGIFDEQEHQFVGNFGGMGNGWNTISIRLGSFQNKEMDKTKFNYFRLFNNTAFDSASDFVFKIDNIRFEKEEKTSTSDYTGPVEEYMFFVLDNDTEQQFLVNCTASQSGAAFRFCDTNSEIVYKFPIINRQNATEVLFTGIFSQQVLVQVSHDGKSWTDVYRYEFDEAGEPHQGDPKKQITFDLMPFIDLNKYSDIYIRIGDAYPSNGWGTCIYSDQATRLEVRYKELTPQEWDAIESAPDDRSISLLTGTTGFGTFKPDTANKTNGYSSLMLTIADRNVNSTTFNAIDSTGYDALEFDLFVTDPAMFEAEYQDTGIELSSQGKCDNGEICWRFSDIAASGDIKEGWNHITLLFRDAKPDDRNAVEFDPTAINFFRLFFVGTPAEYVGGTFGIDNVRLTKAAAERDAAQAAIDQAAADKVIERIGKLGEITLKSEKAIERAQKAYNELTDAQKALVTNADVLTAAVAKYEELLNAEQNPDDTDDEEGTTDSDDENADDSDNTDDEEDTTEDGEDDTDTPDDKPADKGSMGALIIIIVVAVVVIAGAVVAIILIKKKKK